MGIFDQWSSVLPRHTKACRAIMPSIPLITSIKNNCLKLKNEVGMAVLKSKPTRVVASYIEIISTYVYSTSLRLLF